MKMLYHIGYIDMAFHQCVHTHVFSDHYVLKIFFSKTLITLATLIQFLVSMYSQMIYQMIILWKSLYNNCCIDKVSLHLCSKMLCHTPFLPESLVTLDASVRHFCSMSSQSPVWLLMCNFCIQLPWKITHNKCIKMYFRQCAPVY